MATPTPSHNAGKHPAVGTPSHLANFSSPAPRSVPSPAAQRSQQAGAHRSGSSAAANHAGTNADGQGAAVGGGPTSGGSSAGPVAAATSSSAAMNFDSPAALGLSLSGMDGGVGMGLSMSGMSGLQSLVGGGLVSVRADDEERRRRLEAVVAALRGRTGRVGEEGVERMCQRCGFSTIWEDRKAEGRRVLAVAGQSIMVDIDFDADAVTDVSLSFPTSTTALTATSATASAILRRDLVPHPPAAALTWTLDAFGANLARLARLDALSSGGVNCYEALSGVYLSLQKLFEHETAEVRARLEGEDGGDAERAKTRGERARREVLCKRSGRPRLNASGRIGLAIEYWMGRRHVLRPAKRGHRPQTPGQEQDGDAMDVDGATTSSTLPPNERSRSDEDDPHPIFSLSIECESSPSTLYPSLRISDAWLSDSVTKPANITSHDDEIDWLDPPPTYISTSSSASANGKSTNDDAMALVHDDGSKLPDARFVARLQPPLVLPLQTVVQVLDSVGVSLPPESVRATTFEGLALGREGADAEVSAAAAGTGGELARGLKGVQVPGNDKGADGKGALGMQERTHEYALFVGKTEYGRVLEEVPFAHPRQLVQILPILRQYALLNSLVAAPFSSTNSSGTAAEVAAPPLHVDLSLTTMPIPHLTAVFPRSAISASTPTSATLSHSPTAATDSDDMTLDDLVAPATATNDHNPSTSNGSHDTAATTLAVAVLPNADLAVLGETANAGTDHGKGEDADADVMQMSVGGGGGSADEEKHKKRIARALEVCEEVGTWVEWVRRAYE